MGSLRVTVKDNFSPRLQKKLSAAGPGAAHTLALQIARDTEPFVPAKTGSFASRTQVAENRILYPGPRAKYLYNGKAMVDAATGKGPMRIAARNGAEIIRFQKGARLKASAKPLKMSRALHPKAQDHWFEASKAQNLENWLQTAGKAVENELE